MENMGHIRENGIACYKYIYLRFYMKENQWCGSCFEITVSKYVAFVLILEENCNNWNQTLWILKVSVVQSLLPSTPRSLEKVKPIFILLCSG